MKRQSPGFTTLELVLVIAVIGILAGVWLSFSPGRESSARLQTAASEVTEIVKAANTWREIQGSALFTGISISGLVTANLYPRTTNTYGGAITVASFGNNRSITVTQGGIPDSASATNLQTLLGARGGVNVTATGSGPYSVSADY